MTVCTVTGWQCHCQPPEIPCDGLAELRKAYAEWRALAERRKQELSLAEEGLANYAQENARLRAQVARLLTALDHVRDADSVEEVFRIAVAELDSQEPQSAPHK